MLRRVEAENMVASSGDVVEGELSETPLPLSCGVHASWAVTPRSGFGARMKNHAVHAGRDRANQIAEDDDVIDPNDVASDSD